MANELFDKEGRPKQRIVENAGSDVFGLVTDTPAVFTLLRRLKDLLTGIVLSASTAVIGKIRLVTATGDEITDDTLDAIKITGKDLVSVVAKLFEWTSSSWIATQALTSDGIQWSDEKTLPASDPETQVFGAIFEPPKAGTLIAVELGLVAQMKSSAATEAKKWRWKARNKAGTWVNLHGEVSENLTTGYVEKTRSGNFFAITNFAEVPFEIGLFGTPSANETFICQVKNSSQVTAIYKPS